MASRAPDFPASLSKEPTRTSLSKSQLRKMSRLAPPTLWAPLAESLCRGPSPPPRDTLKWPKSVTCPPTKCDSPSALCTHPSDPPSLGSSTPPMDPTSSASEWPSRSPLEFENHIFSGSVYTYVIWKLMIYMNQWLLNLFIVFFILSRIQLLIVSLIDTKCCTIHLWKGKGRKGMKRKYCLFLRFFKRFLTPIYAYFFF